MAQQLGVIDGGWLRFARSEGTPGVVYARAAEGDHGRLVIVELYVPPVPEGIRSGDLRSIPIAELEAWVNSPYTAAAIRRRLNMPGAPMHELIAGRKIYGGATLPRVTAAGNLVIRREADWRELAYWSLIRDSPVARVAPPVEKLPVERGEAPGALVLDVPGTRPYGDDFYARVARAYTMAVQRTHAPAAAIADANELPITTVRWWVSEARRRGMLPPARKGKAG